MMKSLGMVLVGAELTQRTERLQPPCHGLRSMAMPGREDNKPVSRQKHPQRD